MHDVSRLPSTAQSSLTSARLRRTTDSPPLYRQVCAEIERIAMAAPLGEESPLPPEGELIAEFGVSRGTLRRATDELAREGLLRIEAGRGTFVVQSTKVRLLVWDRLMQVAVPDSRFDMDLSRFIPDFEGREKCDERLCDLSSLTSTQTIFVAPDNSLETFRARALAERKQVIVPTYGMRRGFVLLDGKRIPKTARPLAATLDGMERLGTRLSLTELRALSPVGLVVTGAVAVSAQGLHFGPGDGFFDLEWGLLRHCGLVTAQTPVVASVHDCQVLDAPIRPGPHDAVVDLIVTPRGTQECTPSLPKPDGILWHEIRRGIDNPGPYVRELLAEQQPGVWHQPSDQATGNEEPR